MVDANNAMRNYLGCRFVLEAGKAERLLWLEGSDGSAVRSLASVAGELFVVHFDGSDMRVVRESLADQGIGNVTFTQLLAHDNSLPFSDDSFDAVVMPDGIHTCFLQNSLGAQNVGSALHSLFAEVYRVLKCGGYVYVDLRNKYSYKRISELFRKAGNRDRDQGADGDPSVGLLKNVMSASGFDGIDVYKLLGSNGVVEEVILSGQYRSAKNSFTFKQEVKNVLLSSPLARVFAPSLGIVATKGSGRPRYLDVLVGELAKVGILPNCGDRRCIVKRYLVLPGKVILSIGDVGRRYGEKIVILPLDVAVLDRLRDEAMTLEALHDATLSIQSLIPRFFMEGELGGQVYFVQQEMPGTSVDAPVASLEKMTSRAVRLLIDFHSQTTQEITLNDESFGILFSSLLRRVVEALGPGIASSIDRIEEITRAVLYGKRFSLVWMHGDFKIENLIFDPDSLQISGIIDWDLSRKDGYPLIDLMYLIAYNRVIREGREVEEILLDCMVPQEFSDFEREIWDEYMCALGIGEDLVGILIMVFCMHHLAYRRDVAACTGKTIENMLLVLAAVEEMTESKYGRGSLQ